MKLNSRKSWLLIALPLMACNLSNPSKIEMVVGAIIVVGVIFVFGREKKR